MMKMPNEGKEKSSCQNIKISGQSRQNTSKGTVKKYSSCVAGVPFENGTLNSAVTNGEEAEEITSKLLDKTSPVEHSHQNPVLKKVSIKKPSKLSFRKSSKSFDKVQCSDEPKTSARVKRFLFTKSYSIASNSNANASKIPASRSMSTISKFNSLSSPSVGAVKWGFSSDKKQNCHRVCNTNFIAQNKTSLHLIRDKRVSAPQKSVNTRRSPCVRRTTSFEVSSTRTNAPFFTPFRANSLTSPQFVKSKLSISDSCTPTRTRRRKDGVGHASSSYSSSSVISTPFSSLQSTPTSIREIDHLTPSIRDPHSVPISPHSVKSRQISGDPLNSHENRIRVRSYDGKGLTIRIPRNYSDRGSQGCSQQPLMSPTHPHVILSTLENSRAVGKSKSLTTSIDKLSLSQKAPSSGSSSRESSFTGSRGSTPSNNRSSTSPRPVSCRSTPARDTKPPRTPEGLAPERDDKAVKSNSPTGSEVSLNSSISVHSSTHSINSANSTKSSNASNKSQTSNRSCPSGRSSSQRCSPRAASEPPSSTMARKKTTTREITKKSSSIQTGINRSPKTSLPIAKKSTSSSSSLPRSPTEDKKSVSTPPPKPASRKSTPSRMTPPRSSGSSASSYSHTSVGSYQKKSLPVFNSYMSLFQVQEKLKKGEVIEGVLRINPKSYDDALISAPVLLGRGDGHLYWRGT